MFKSLKIFHTQYGPTDLTIFNPVISLFCRISTSLCCQHYHHLNVKSLITVASKGWGSKNADDSLWWWVSPSDYVAISSHAVVLERPPAMLIIVSLWTRQIKSLALSFCGIILHPPASSTFLLYFLMLLLFLLRLNLLILLLHLESIFLLMSSEVVLVHCPCSY